MSDEKIYELTAKGIEMVKEMAKENPEWFRLIAQQFAAAEFPNDPEKQKLAVEEFLQKWMGSIH